MLLPISVVSRFCHTLRLAMRKVLIGRGLYFCHKVTLFLTIGKRNVPFLMRQPRWSVMKNIDKTFPFFPLFPVQICLFSSRLLLFLQETVFCILKNPVPATVQFSGNAHSPLFFSAGNRPPAGNGWFAVLPWFNACFSADGPLAGNRWFLVGLRIIRCPSVAFSFLGVGVFFFAPIWFLGSDFNAWPAVNG